MEKLRALVVEEESVVALAIRKKLESLGYTVAATAHSSREAIQQASEIHPDVVLMDVTTAGSMDDTRAAAQIREQFTVPIVYFAARGDQTTLEDAAVAKPSSYILKPFDDRDLRVAIENSVDRHEMEQRQRMLESIVTNMGEGLVVVGAGKEVIFCNPAAEALLGIRAQDIIGHHVEVFERLLCTRVADVAAKHSEWSKAISRIEEAPRVYCDLMSGSTTRAIEATPFVVGDKTRRLGIGIVLRDVTKEREIDRMKTEFVSIASHELRTPMASIYGFAELLLTRCKALPEDNRSWVETIHRESKRLSDMVEDLLNVSRIEAGQMSLKLEAVPLEPIAGAVINSLGMGNRRHTLSLSIPSNLPAVSADAAKLEQVLVNLVDNAIKYSPAGGTVTVRATPGSASGEITVSVSDQGLGIPAEELPRLFTRFHRVSRPDMAGLRGTGLGLYIVKSLVEQMGGQVWAVSEVGKGSTFHLTLPAAPAGLNQICLSHTPNC